LTLDANKGLIRRYYEEMWNRWDLSLAEALLSPALTFRGSLGTKATGIREFCRYARSVWTAFPDFHNEVADLLADGDFVVARLTYTGTHRGPLMDAAPTGRSVRYAGIAWFTIETGLISEVYVASDWSPSLIAAPADSTHSGEGGTAPDDRP
jgi:steroid delta-isomerase-like uncharacterized protein